MKTHFFAFALLATFVATNVFAQEEEHSDVEFGYNDVSNPTELEVEAGEATATGVPIFEGEFEPFNGPSDLSAEDPGFATSPDENLLINSGDQIFLNVLDASSDPLFGGLGYVTHYNFASKQLEASGRITVQGNSPTFPDVVLDGASFEPGGSLTQFVAAGETDSATGELAEFDRHIVFDIDDSTAQPGAYGILAQLQSNFDGTSVDQFELTSEPFWIILNNGLAEEDFENFAVAAFETAAIPEPGTFGLLAAGMSGVLLRRRRR